MSDSTQIPIGVDDQATKSINDIIKSLGLLTNSVQSATDALNKTSLKPLKDNLKSAGNETSLFKDIAVGAWRQVGAIITNAVTGAVAGLVELNTSYTNLQKQFERAGDTKAFDSIIEGAKQSGLNLNLLGDVMGEILPALNGDVASAANAFDILKAASATGTNAETIKKLGGAIADVASKTEVGAADFEKFSKLGAGSMDTLYASVAKSAGKTIDQVKQLAKDGKLSGNAFRQGLVDAAGNVKIPPIDSQSFDNKINAIGATATQAFDSLKKSFMEGFTGSADIGAPVQRILTLLEELGKNEAVKQFAAELGKISGTALTAVADALESMGKGLKYLSEHIDTVKKIGLALTIGATAAWVAAGGFTALTASVAASAVAFGAAALAAAPFIAIGAAVAGVAYLIINNWDKIGPALSSVWDTVKSTFNSVADFLTGLPAAFMQLGTNIIQGLIDGITGTAGKVFDSIKDIASGIKNLFTGDLEIASPSKVFVGYGENIGQGAAIGINNSAPAVRTATSDLASEPINAFPASSPTSNVSNNSPTTNTTSNTNNTNHNNDINITLNGTGFGENIKAMIEDAMNEIFDTMNMNTGSA